MRHHRLQRAVALLVLAPFLSATPAAARTAAEAPPRAADAPDRPAATEAEADLRARYREGFGAVLADRCQDALTPLRAVRDGSADPELRGAADALVSLCEARLAYTAGEAPAGAQAPPRTGRFPFVAWSTVIGLTAGIETALALDLDGVPANTALIMGTTGLGFTASLLATRRLQVTPAEAGLYGSGAVLGTYNAVLLADILDLEQEAPPLLALGGTLAGAAGGFLTARALHMSPGDAGLLSSAGLWGGIASALLLPLIEPERDNTTLTILLLGADVGALAGLGLSRALELSQDRVLLMDLGALLGGLGLGGLGLILVGSDISSGEEDLVFGMALGGMVGGIVTTYLLTQGMDAGRDGGPAFGALLNFDGDRFALGAPAPALAPDPAAPGRMQVYLPLAAGRL